MAYRRTFLKTIGMFACLPTLEVRQGIPFELMQACCDPQPTRWNFADPYIEDGLASATDGRIGVQVFNSMGIADIESPIKYPPLSSVVNRFWKPSSRWNEWPKARYEPSDCGGCWRCKSAGYLGKLEECSRCNGFGEIRTDRLDDFGEHIYFDCPSCISGYRSQTKCPGCNGKPWGDQHEAQGAMQLEDNLKIASSYHYLISQFPGVRWCVGQHDYEAYENKHLIVFEFEGGRGLLMPLRNGD